MSDGPHLIRWTDHAFVKAATLGFSRGDVEQAVIRNHDARRRNRGTAVWRVTVGRLVVLYDHPDRGDSSTARIITLWRPGSAVGGHLRADSGMASLL